MLFYPPLLIWWLTLFLIGLSFAPLCYKLFPLFVDKGYAFAKIIGILIISYTIYLFGSLHIIPFTYPAVIAALVIAALCNWIPVYIYLSGKRGNTKTISRIEGMGSLIRTILIEEVIFFGLLVIYSIVRGQEPSIHGLEKFMDFGFMNSILRTRFFPPLDMWYGPDAQSPGGYAINYYYFGHLYAAVLIKLSQIPSPIGYNLVLGTILSLGFTQTFSLIASIARMYKKTSDYILYVMGIIGGFLVNLSGNFHTIYLFTTGYPNDKPIPFWQILSTFHPEKYWYPNATRFIPYTIHEFPSYSYVVADLHGHVFDIPLVLLTIALLFIFFIKNRGRIHEEDTYTSSPLSLTRFPIPHTLKRVTLYENDLYAILFGGMIAVHYMTNAFDGPIYLLLLLSLSFILFRFTRTFLQFNAITIASFILFSLPFTLFFKPFASGIGVNCAPSFLTKLQKLGPFLFEPGNCQISPLWMLFILWGFFLINLILMLLSFKLKRSTNNQDTHTQQPKHLRSIQKAKETSATNNQWSIELFFLIFFCFGFFLIIIPEFFYVKDIYPQHFRANTMFKLGYQAFILMSLSSTMVIYFLRNRVGNKTVLLKMIFIFGFVLVSLYPFQAFPGYYGRLDKQVTNLDGLDWLRREKPEDAEIVKYINTHISGQPTILEAQGDSYTDFNHISSYTGLPTIAGWYVHEWLWRGSPEYVGKRAPDIAAIYESADISTTLSLLKQYRVSYIIVSRLERQKYPNLNEEKLSSIARKMFESNNKLGALYRLK